MGGLEGMWQAVLGPEVKPDPNFASQLLLGTIQKSLQELCKLLVNVQPSPQ